MDWNLITPVIAGGIRSLAGWLENSFKDGRIDALELRKLGETILRVGMVSFGLIYGLPGLGIEIEPLAASGAAIVIDFILSALKKKA